MTRTLAALRKRLPYLDIHECVGTGASARVYRATDQRLGREVGLKIFEICPERCREQIARFRTEARLLASLNHDRIVTLHDVVEIGRACVLVMEYVEGKSLDELLGRGPLHVPAALAVAKQIAEALEAVHCAGVVHRDVKPSNIKLVQDCGPKLLDFGIAVALEPPAHRNGEAAAVARRYIRSAEIHGTVPYMSPEQVRGLPLDTRTDIWSYGCVVYQMLAGRSPFLGASPADTLARIRFGEPDWSQLPENVPPDIHALLRSLLEKNCHRRIPSMADVRLRLDACGQRRQPEQQDRGMDFHWKQLP
jgi:serine/threonine-protein kinase